MDVGHFPHLPQKDHLVAAISDRPNRFVGVDLHKQTITIAVVDGTRKLVSRRRFSNFQTDAIVSYLKSHASLELVVEATASDEWFVQLVDPHALNPSARPSPHSRVHTRRLVASGAREQGRATADFRDAHTLA
jgi:hypothetical protein